MDRYYTVKEAASALFPYAKNTDAKPVLADWEVRKIRKVWGGKIIRAILDGKLIGLHEGLIIDPDKPGATVAAVVCEIRADDLNAWLKFIRCPYSLNEKGTTATKKSADQSDWKNKAIKLANEIGQKRHDGGQQEITARNICKDVQAELAKDTSTHGQRGQRLASSIRSDALKGWKFTPKKSK